MTRVEALAITAAIIAVPSLAAPAGFVTVSDSGTLGVPDAESVLNDAIELASRLLNKAAAL